MLPRFLRSNFSIWDFSLQNLIYLHQFHDLTADYVPFWNALSCADFSFTPAHTQHLAAVPQNLEVLFYGWSNARRRLIGDQLQRAGVRAYVGELYGESLKDAYISRARIVLSIHYYENAALEVHRINRLLALGKCVVAEHGSDTNLDALYEGVVHLVQYTKLIETVVNLLRGDPAVLEECGARSRRWIYRQVVRSTGELDSALRKAITKYR